MKKVSLLLLVVSIFSITGCSDDIDKSKNTSDSNESLVFGESNKDEKVELTTQTDKTISQNKEKKTTKDFKTATVTRIVDDDIFPT